jgi:hypothetical protein
LQLLFLSPWISLVSKKKVTLVALKPNKDLLFMNELFEAGSVKVVIDGPYKLEDVPEIFRLFERGEHKGKVVVTMDLPQRVIAHSLCFKDLLLFQTAVLKILLF